MGRAVGLKPRRAFMSLKELQQIKQELEQLLSDLKKTHLPRARFEILERFKNLVILLKQGT